MKVISRYFMMGLILLFIELSLAKITPNVSYPAYADTGVLYAAPTIQGSGDCSGWDNACTLQYALSHAGSGDEIWVKMGVHYPGRAGHRSATFTLQNGVSLYGGFAGTETQRNQRNWQTNKTILSGDIDENDTNTDGNSIAETTADIHGNNAYHVVTGGGTNHTAVLDGFVITAGQANDVTPDDTGGGMYNSFSSPTLINLIFSGNFGNECGGMYNESSNPILTNVTFRGNSGTVGGGMYNTSSNPMLNNVAFSGNSVDGFGGGMYNESSSPTLKDVTFNGNSAGYKGGGMRNTDLSSPTLTNVTFTNNTATDSGGGMYNSDNSSPTLTNVTFNSNSAGKGGGMRNSAFSSPTLTNVTFSNNTATDSGGGIYNLSSSPTLTNVTFSGNSANNNGGGMYNYNNSNPTLTNVTFSGNSANSEGGGMYNESSDPGLTNVIISGNIADYGGGMYNESSGGQKLVNVTFSGNSAKSFGGGMYNSNSSPALRNVIMWGDTAPNGREIYNSSSTPDIAYSDIQGCIGFMGWNPACGTDGGGNIDAAPLFVDADGADDTPGTADDNLRLQLTSPAIDAGNNAAVPSGVTTDLDGNPRIVNGVVDMGAYEVQRKIFLPLIMRG